MKTRTIQWQAGLCLLLMCTFFLQCQNTKELPPQIPSLVKPPIPELDPAFSAFSFNATEGTRFVMPSGSEVIVPPMALTDSLGQGISGAVEGKYRELHDVLDIYLAGIPMAYDSLSNFETAGTFEVRLSQNGQSVYVDPNKAIEVKMASFESEDDYDFYYLDEKGRQWDSLGTASPSINPEWTKQKKLIRKKTPRLRFPLNRKYFALNYEAILDIYFNNKFSKGQDSLLTQKMKAYGLGWTKVASRTVIDFKGRKEPAVTMVWKNLSGKSFPEWTNHRYAQLEQIKGRRYQLTMYSKDSSQHFVCKIEAVMPLRALFAFPAEQWKKDYKKTMAQVREEEERLKMMAEVYRSFKITNLGIYNWDRLLKEEASIQLQADFQFTQPLNDRLHELEVVYVTGDNKAIIKFPQSNWHVLSLMPDPGARMFCLLPGKQLAVFSAKAYSKINFKELREMPEPVKVFQMNTTKQNFQTAADFRKLLGV